MNDRMYPEEAYVLLHQRFHTTITRFRDSDGRLKTHFCKDDMSFQDHWKDTLGNLSCSIRVKRD